MYSDLERKIFRIYFNHSIHGKNPTLKELMKLTRKSEVDVKETVEILMQRGLLIMDEQNNLIANRIKVIN
ncbi:hypothetical protein WQ54_08665 [Bacillus sp. SA1-12]|uniref:hypothetical protein n=1 Tax=Bacillus sp. SA1-12 TaxID=1455638 RepID=UPI0006265714|nr:hypothetical protein [Bacillus sp. SA1-12]KKI92671.1 hypothetical protein WQ54_08665 [Bacillus sp. SA1-12]